MSDRITVLRCAGNLVLTKIHHTDGTRSYDRPKWFTESTFDVADVYGVHELIRSLAGQRNACVLRGRFIGESRADGMTDLNGEPVYRPSSRQMRRLASLFEDIPSRWLSLDIDGWDGASIDPCLDPETAVREWIDAHLPDAFHDVSVVWQLSASAGVKPGLRAHLWYWLAEPATGAQLKQWARGMDVDTSFFENVRVHYTADPIFQGIDDPVLFGRCGLIKGLFTDEVALTFDGLPTADDENAVDTDADCQELTLAEVAAMKPPLGLTTEEARDLVMALPAEKFEGYAGWLAVGMALHHEFDGSDAGLELFDTFSAERTPKDYDRAEIEEKWRSFGRSTGAPKTMASIKAVVRRHGYDFSLCREQVASATSYREAVETAAKFELSETELDTIAERLVEMGKESGLAAKAGAVKKEVRAARKAREQESLQRLVDDHLTYALKVVEAEGRENLLSTAGAVWRWDAQGVWLRLEDRTVKQLVQRALPQWSRVVSKGMVDSVVDLLRSEVHIEGHRFDIRDPDTINCRNGELVHTADGWHLEEHRRDHYRTAQIPVNYDPEARAPRFERFLSEVFESDPDADDKARAILEMMGYSLVAHCRFERFALLVGAGANGKSVLLRVLETLVGAARVAGVQPSKFSSAFQRAHLESKLVNLVSETRKGEVIDDAALKAIVSGEASTVEHKNRNPFELRPYATCWFGTNHMPHTRDLSPGFFRRVLVVEFNRRFRAEDGTADTDLAQKLEAELPGILNLAVEAYGDALNRGYLTTPESSRIAASRWRRDADQAAQFVEELCVEEPEGATPTGSLFSAYRDWARENGVRHMLTQREFGDRLVKLGFPRRKSTKGVRKTVGLTIRGDADFDGLN